MIKKIWYRIKEKKKKTVVFKKRGENVVIGSDCEFGHPQNIKIGSNVYIGEKTCVFAQGEVVIKDGVIIADRVDIRTANHYYDGEELTRIPFDDKVLIGPVVIEENVWVASHCIILPGVTIGEGAVVAAGAIVTKDVAPFTVVGGNPAVVLKKRDKERYLKLKQEGKLYMKEFHNLERKMILSKKHKKG